MVTLPLSVYLLSLIHIYEETIRHAEEILRATLKEKENLLKKQRLQIEQQKKLIGEKRCV